MNTDKMRKTEQTIILLRAEKETVIYPLFMICSERQKQKLILNYFHMAINRVNSQKGRLIYFFLFLSFVTQFVDQCSINNLLHQDELTQTDNTFLGCFFSKEK
jgi:hypothetical protein